MVIRYFFLSPHFTLLSYGRDLKRNYEFSVQHNQWFVVTKHLILLVNVCALHSKCHNIISSENVASGIGNSSSMYEDIWMDVECIFVTQECLNVP